MHFLMLALAVVVAAVSRAMETSGLGLGFVSISDDEVAAEAAGVSTIRPKLIATTLSGAYMGYARGAFAMLRDLSNLLLRSIFPTLRIQ